MEKNIIHIAFCTDLNYVMPTGVAMISICENNDCSSLFFHIVVTSSTEKSDDIQLVELYNIAVKYGCNYKEYVINSKLLEDFVCTGASYISTTAFARMFLSSLLDENIEKVLYLDCDVIVNGSLDDLWNIEFLEDNPIGAVCDVHANSAMRHFPLGLDVSCTYINSGVLLMNLGCWRKNDFLQKIKQCAIEHSSKFKMLDQDVINYLFAGQITLLPVKYNFQTLFIFEPELYWMVPYKYVGDIKECINNNASIIIHYVTPNKPWKDEWCPMREVWNKYCDLSPWKRMPLQPVITRFDRCNIYKEFVDSYWADAKLMQEVLVVAVKLQMAAVKLRNKYKFVKIGMAPAKWMADILSLIYSIKTKR